MTMIEKKGEKNMKYTLFNKIIRYSKKLAPENTEKAEKFIHNNDLSGFLNFCCSYGCIMPAACRYLESDMVKKVGNDLILDNEKVLLFSEAVGIPVQYGTK